MKSAVELIEALRYKLRMFRVPIEGPTNVFCDNEAVCKNTTRSESTLTQKHHSIAYVDWQVLLRECLLLCQCILP
jgi:hypothetical protein